MNPTEKFSPVFQNGKRIKKTNMNNVINSLDLTAQVIVSRQETVKERGYNSLTVREFIDLALCVDLEVLRQDALMRDLEDAKAGRNTPKRYGSELYWWVCDNAVKVGEMEVYDYFDNATKGFEAERVRLALKSFDDYSELLMSMACQWVESGMEQALYDLKKNGWSDDKTEAARAVTEKLSRDENGDYTDWLKERARKCFHVKFGKLSDMRGVLEGKLKQAKGREKHDNEMLHFTRSFKDKELQSIFSGFKNGGFIHVDTEYNHFAFVFCGRECEDFKPLVWLGNSSTLAYMVDMCFGDTDGDNKWEITKACFVIKGGVPNKNTLRNALSRNSNGWISKPRGVEKIDDILRSIY